MWTRRLVSRPYGGSYSLPFDYDGSVSGTRYGSLLLKPALDFMPIDSFHVTSEWPSSAYAWVKFPAGSA